jgi:hypothetical protein
VDTALQLDVCNEHAGAAFAGWHFACSGYLDDDGTARRSTTHACTDTVSRPKETPNAWTAASAVTSRTPREDLRRRMADASAILVVDIVSVDAVLVHHDAGSTRESP